MHRLSLHNHRADKDKIRPEDVFFFEGLDAHIDKFLFPAGGSIAAIVARPKGGSAALF